MMELTREIAGLFASPPAPLAELPAEKRKAYSIEKTPSGGFTFGFAGRYYLSRHDPVKDALRAADAVRLTPTANLVFFGSCFGRFLVRVLERFPLPDHSPKPVVLILEENPEIAAISFAAEGIAVLKKFETHLVSSHSDLIRLGPDRSFIPVCVNPAILTEIGFYREAYGLLRLVSLNSATKRKFRRVLLRNSCRNIRSLEEMSAASVSPEVPGVVCAAGPSLEESLESLRNVQNRCLIASSDTALPVLLGSGIKPAFVVTGDPQIISHRHFSACRGGIAGSPGTRLVSDITVSPLIPQMFRSGRMNINTGSPILDTLDDPPPLVRMGGSVTAGAFFFLLALGIRKIYFAGQDYGNLIDRTHSRGTVYDRYDLTMNTRVATLGSLEARTHLPGSTRFVTDGGPLWSTPLLVSYCEWLKSEIQGLAGTAGMEKMEIINTSGRSLFRSDSIRRGSLDELATAAVLPASPNLGSPRDDLPSHLVSALGELNEAARVLKKLTEKSLRAGIAEFFTRNLRVARLFGWFYGGRERYFDFDHYGSQRFDENVSLLTGLLRDLS